LAKRKRREQHHLNQESKTKRSYTLGGSGGNEVYKPGFPMNLFGNLKLFSVIGVVVALILVLTAVLTRGNTNPASPDAPPTSTPSPTVDPNATPTPTVDPNASPTPTATPDPKKFQAAEQVVDASKNTYRATLKTNKGDIILEFKADVAPNTVNSFVFLATKDYFDGITFHRVVKNFVIQSGDPTGTGTGGPGYVTNDEPNTISNTRGTVSMAKTAGAANFGSQFFINVAANKSLDYNNTTGGDKFYPFAEVVVGMDVVDAIAATPTDARGKPTEAVTILDVIIGSQPKQ
jgi:peptidylprolyl isomerase